MAENLRVALIQMEIAWEEPQANIRYIVRQLRALQGRAELAVVPEMCTTGFSMHPERWAETNEGASITLLHEAVISTGVALAGSFMARGLDGYYNRGFLLMPDGSRAFRDKRHLFRLGEEGEHYRAGADASPINYRGWNICLMVCYDLRFPVWCRNVGNRYDLLLFVANWPSVRQHSWESLLVARAIENQAYVCGVNRVGTDGMQLDYAGGSKMISYFGDTLLRCVKGKRGVRIVMLDYEALRRSHVRFPAWKDADDFTVSLTNE